MKQKTALLALLAIVMIAGTLPSTTFAKEGRSGLGEGNRSEFRSAPVSPLTSSGVQNSTHEENESEDPNDDDAAEHVDNHGQNSGRGDSEENEVHHATSTGTTTTPSPRPVPTPVPCVASTSLTISAVVFTDTTVVKIKQGVTRTVFESTATTSTDIIAAIATRLTTASTPTIEAALTVTNEARVSTSTDMIIPSDTCTPATSSSTATSTVAHDDNIQARIAELQSLIQALLKLLSSRFGQ